MANKLLIARNYITDDVTQYLNTIPDIIDLKFDDVVITTTNRKLIYSMYFWLYHFYYPETPLLSSHFIESVKKGNKLNSATSVELASIIYKDVIKTYNIVKPIDKEHLLDLTLLISNNIDNQVSKLAEAYVTSCDILDFIDVVEHPVIKQAIADTKPNNDSIQNTYKTILEVINNCPTIAHSGLVKSVKAKTVNVNQVLQCVGVRGFLTEVSGAILPTPILTNFTYGLKTAYEMATESRSTVKSLMFSEAPLQDAEYFARRLQLLTMKVESIEYVDCGSTEYIQWRVTPPSYDDEGKVVYKGDLNFMIGAYYLDEKTDKLLEITGKEQHLESTVIKIRNLLHCKLENPHNVCMVCFGAIAANVSRHVNLGHLCAATMTQQTSQSVLSTKHLDASSVSTNIVLNEFSSKFFSLTKDKSGYIVRKEIKDKNLSLTVNRDEAFGLIDILNVDNVANINPNKISSITSVDISYTHRNEPMTVNITINQENRNAMLTSEFLLYLKTHKWETDSRNNFVFDLSYWDFSLPVFKLPSVEFSFSDHSHQVSKMIESNMNQLTERENPHSAVYTLQELFSLVNSKLNVNIAALSVIIYACQVRSPNDLSMGRNSPTAVLGVAGKIIGRGSLSNSYAYKQQANILTDPASFFQGNREDSCMDVCICPAEVVEYKKSLKQ